MKLSKTYKFPKALKRLAVSGNWTREMRKFFAEADSLMDERKSTSRKDAETYAETSKK